ncbi:hypothetical protein PV755_44510 [Streptomyces caniscabiei]|uniref:hypothetical protein n=1 Tax=Streptomyces caniscabiei TaxID=2746961 RepID=UPI0029A61247|nr:hypothetical protein [Streptomyces caniscabiei]MDX3515885.1 hypothetical protein [Streptomyces caniscabiei]MDX3725065.1 hypothetical protein [Streptomyces caniscabiei]
MALWVCGGEAGCGTKYAVGLFRCPRCHNDEFFEDGDPMAKISRNGGASTDTVPAPEPEAEAVDGPAPEPDEAPDVTEHMAGPAQRVEVRGEHGPELVEMEGGEESSPGSSSSASTEKPQTNSEPSSKTRPRRARKTASPSEKDQTESGSAPSTDGEKTDGTSASDEAADA